MRETVPVRLVLACLAGCQVPAAHPAAARTRVLCMGRPASGAQVTVFQLQKDGRWVVVPGVTTADDDGRFSVPPPSSPTEFVFSAEPCAPSERLSLADLPPELNLRGRTEGPPAVTTSGTLTLLARDAVALEVVPDIWVYDAATGEQLTVESSIFGHRIVTSTPRSRGLWVDAWGHVRLLLDGLPEGGGELLVTLSPDSGRSGETAFEYFGVGVLLCGNEKGVIVSAVRAAGPAVQAGIESGQQVLSVDGRNVALLGADAAMQMLRGYDEREVQLELLLPSGQVKTVRLKRVRLASDVNGMDPQQ